MTITAKVQIYPNEEQAHLLMLAGRTFAKACNYVSDVVFEGRSLNQVKLQKTVYAKLRADYLLPSQMACNVVRHVIGNYRTIQANQGKWIKPNFLHTTYALSWNRDYSLTDSLFSVGTLSGRIKVAYANGGMEQYFDGTWEFGAAKVVCKHGKWFLHISVSKEVGELQNTDVANVVGVDLGMNFLAAAYDSNGKTTFFDGKQIKHKRGHYKKIRQQLQKRQTSSARNRLLKIGSRENRWMQDINHCISKALVDRNPAKTAFVLEDLTGVRNATEKVRIKDRYVSVSWAFFDLRKKLEYKSQLAGSKVIIVSPKYTSQTCPKCGHVEKASRNKRTRVFCCTNCNYKSNDDRIGAMNLHRKGIEHLSAVAVE